MTQKIFAQNKLIVTLNLKEIVMPKPMTADKPFPTTEGLCRDAYSLRVISPAYATPASELNAVLQYLYHYHHFKACGYADFADTIESIAIAEMMHLKLLGASILALGAAPIYTANPTALFNFYSSKFVTYSRSLVCMAEDDVRAEKQAIHDYERILRVLKNAKVKEIIERILEDERMHLAAFEDILHSLKS